MNPITGELAELCPDVLEVRAVLSRDSFGKATSWGAWTPITCRIVGGHRQVKDKAGKMRDSSVRAILMEPAALTTDGYEFRLPSRYTPRVVEALAIDPSNDENGPHHEAVNFA